jgi:hypothetical protein
VDSGAELNFYGGVIGLLLWLLGWMGCHVVSSQNVNDEDVHAFFHFTRLTVLSS